MIAIARNNLSYLYLSPNSFLCNSIVHFLPSILFFSTSRIKRLIPCPRIYDVLVNKHNFSPELASSLAASPSLKSRSPKGVDSVLSYLKENSFTTTQLEKIVIYDPGVLGFHIEKLKFKFKVFQDLGLSSDDIAKIMCSNQSILRSNTQNKIIPRITVLKSLFVSNHDVAKLLRKSAWFVIFDLEKTLLPNVEILKSCSIPMERVLHYLHTYPRSFLVKSDIMRKSVDKAIEIGVPMTSARFIQAANAFSFLKEGMWEVKLQTFRDLGFSDNDIFTMFRKKPFCLWTSEKKVKKVTELLLATGKYDISNIVNEPSPLACSIEKRLKPRLQIIRLLESRKLIQKWPSLSSVATLTDDRFIDRFVRSYYDEIGKEDIIKIYLSGQKVTKLQAADD